MARRLGMTPALILQALSSGHRYGFDIMEATGLASGVVYPALGRLERDGLVTSAWEDEGHAHRRGRPARRYYQITGAGRTALAAVHDRARRLQQLAADVSGSER